MRRQRKRYARWVWLLGAIAAVAIAIRAIAPRMRGEAEEAAGLKLVLNLAARRLHVYEGGKRTHTYVVSVGMPGHRTPTGSYRISHVVWNPWWNPPASKWAKGHKKTPPGPGNPMGRVKMYFREMYYIHGTPATSTLGQPVSHGCVRMRNSDAIALARLVLSHGAPNISEARIDHVVKNYRATETMGLKRPVPLEVVSHAAQIDDEKLEIDGSEDQIPEESVWEEAMEALRSAGFDMRTLDRARLRTVVQQGVRGPVSVPLASLRRTAAQMPER
jgi:murein L,D-transpeptidase YcbB/YkuD